MDADGYPSACGDFRRRAPPLFTAWPGQQREAQVVNEVERGHGDTALFEPGMRDAGAGVGGVVAVEGYMERRRRLYLEKVLQNFYRPDPCAFFLSYRRDQSGSIARALRSALAARIGGKNVFLDEKNIPPGQPFPKEIIQAILGCSVMLVIIGPHWLDARDAESGQRRLDLPGDWVRQEVEEGLRNDKAVIVPVLVDDAHVPGRQELPPGIQALSDRQAFRLAGDDLTQEADALIDRIRQGQLSPPRPAGAPPDGAVPSART